jgi:hypothetical protein
MNNAQQRWEIFDLTINYASCLDDRRWDAFGQLFEDTLMMDYSSFSGKPPMAVSREDFVADARSVISGFDQTQHLISNHRFAFEGDRCEASAQLVAYHTLTTNEGVKRYVVGGFYNYGLVYKEIWKVAAIRLTVKWTEGEFALVRQAKKRWLSQGGT